MKTISLNNRQSLLASGVTNRQVEILLDGKYINVYNQTLANVSKKLNLTEDEMIDACGNIYDFEKEATKMAKLVPMAKKIEVIIVKEEMINLTEEVTISKSCYSEMIQKYSKDKYDIIWLKNGLSVKLKGESKNLFVFNQNRLTKEGLLIGTIVINSLANMKVPQVINKKVVFLKETLPAVLSVTITEATSILKENSI